MPLFCDRCKHRPTCRQLCPAAERYSCQDYVSIRERYSPDPDFLLTPSSCGWGRIQETAYTPMPDFPFLKPIENNLLQAFFCEGLTYREAAQRFHKKENTVKAILARAKKKIAANVVPIFSISERVNFST